MPDAGANVIPDDSYELFELLQWIKWGGKSSIEKMKKMIVEYSGIVIF